MLVQNNKAASTGGYGGGVFFDSGTASKVYIEDPARIITNTGVYGGGIVVFTGYEMYLTGGRIAGNQASHGGGIWTRLSQLILSGGVIEDNIASNTGGGIYIDGRRDWSTRKVQITGNVQIIHNKASQGGGVGVGENTVLTMDGGLTRNNKATYGGGVWVSAVMGQFVIKKSAETGTLHPARIKRRTCSMSL